MARIRTIKPGFWTDERIGSLSPWARLLFIGLWNLADDEGRLKLPLPAIKGQLFPFDSRLKIELIFNELIESGLILFRDGITQIRNFARHQVINRPRASELPDITTFNDSSVNTHGTFTAGKGKGMEKEEEEEEEAREAPIDPVIVEAVSQTVHLRPLAEPTAFNGKFWSTLTALKRRYPDNISLGKELVKADMYLAANQEKYKFTLPTNNGRDPAAAARKFFGGWCRRALEPYQAGVKLDVKPKTTTPR